MINTIGTGQSLVSAQFDKVQDNRQSKAQLLTDKVDNTTTGARAEVTLSSQAKNLDQLQKNMADKPSFDAKKVAEIKQQVDQGRYEIDAERIAHNMLAFES